MAGIYSRSNKADYKDYELEIIEKQVDKYRDVLEKMVRKLPTAHNGGSSSSSSNSSSAVNGVIDTQDRDKRIRKHSHYKVGTALVESSKELGRDVTLHHVLFNCGESSPTPPSNHRFLGLHQFFYPNPPKDWRPLIWMS